MSVKSDRWIRRMVLEHGIISPFWEKQVRSGIISFGLSAHEYDIGVADEELGGTTLHHALPAQMHG